MDLENYLKRYKDATEYNTMAGLAVDVAARENEFRELFSRQRESWDIPELDYPFQSLIPAFKHQDVFLRRGAFQEEEDIPKMFALKSEARIPVGQPTIVSSSEFNRNWDLFTEGSMKYVNWDNVFVAGGSVMACLCPISPEYNTSNRSRREYLHDVGYPGSDIDLFFYGLEETEAKAKMIEVYEAICEAIPYEVIVFRSTHAVTIVSQYPYRHIQIVLRLYSSPYEVLAGFDVDTCAVGFDGKDVWVAPRCHQALVSQILPVDMTRRSPTYEMRLAKYASRGFEVAVPALERRRVDPMLFERSWKNVRGLAKLLLLEVLRTPEARTRYKELHRSNKRRPPARPRFGKLRAYSQTRWAEERLEELRAGADASDYSTVFLPWGPGHCARNTMGMMHTKDYILNSPWFAKERRHHIHPCFFGTMPEVLKDCCPNDPPIPDDVNPEELEAFVRGKLTFLVDNPGRQMIGSFHPITDEDWSEGAYFSEVRCPLVTGGNLTPGLCLCLL
eukprot:gene18187-21666_t